MAAVTGTLLIGVAASSAQEVDLSESQSSATPKKIKVTRRDIDFGQVTAPKVETTTVSNPGSQSVAVLISRLAAPFSLTGPSTFTLGPKTSETVRVRFAPQAKGRFRDSLTVCGSGKPIRVTLKGQGRGPFPVINSVTIEPQPVVTSATLSASASDPSGGPLTYSWTVGGVQVASGADAVWNSPGVPGEYLVGLTVTNSQGAIATATALMMVGSQSPWPRFRRTIQATGLSAVDTSANSGSVKWVFTPSLLSDSNPALGNSPAIGPDGTIYVSNGDCDFYAVNPDGSQKWKINIGGNANDSSPAVVADGTIYVASSHVPLTSGCGTGPSGPGGLSGNFYALNPDGSQKWNFPTTGTIYSSPAIGADGTIYFGSNNGTFYALNPDGTQTWNFTSPLATLFGNFFTTPAIGTDGTIYVGYNFSGSSPPPQVRVFYAFNPDGTKKWQFDFSVFGNVIFGSSSAAIGADGTIYVGTSISPAGGNLVAIKPDGTLMWTAGNAPFLGSPAIGADGTVYDSTTDSNFDGVGFPFFAYNPSGSVKWTFPQVVGVGALFSDSAIGADGTIYAGFSEFSTERSLFSGLDALNPDGSQKWSVAGPAGAPAIGADGTLYVAAGSLYAIH